MKLWLFLLMTVALPLSAGKWVPAQNGVIPTGAVKAGHEANGKALYICGAGKNGGFHIGKTRPGLRACNIGFSGKEYAISNYHVLTGKYLWKNAQNGHVPPQAYPGGYEKNKAKLFICRAKFKGGKHIGKLRTAFRGCNIAWGGKEYVVRKYQVLLNRGWVKTSNGRLVGHPQKAGKETNGKPLYICKAKFKGGIHPGKTRPAFRGCNIGWGGKEHVVANYKLFFANQKWKNGANGSIPANAIRGGKESKGTPLYVCRANIKGGRHIGKIRSGFRGCNVGFAGKEYRIPRYQVLVK